MRVVLFVLVSMIAMAANGQDLYFGIRAGLGYSQLVGPTSQAQDESYGLNNGLHFGFNIGYEFNDFFSIRTEVLYSQRGTKYDYDGDGYYIFRPTASDRFAYQDSSKIKLEVSNAYISFPLTFHVRTLEKLEFHGGAYIAFLISPVGGGTYQFGSTPEVRFLQDLIYQYRNDGAGQITSEIFAQPSLIRILVNEEEVSTPNLSGAYYFIPPDVQENGDLINPALYRGIDYGLTGGFSYYINRGLYLGLKGWYGLRDVTNNQWDFSREFVNPDGSLIYVDDYDRNLSFELSLGFKF